MVIVPSSQWSVDKWNAFAERIISIGIPAAQSNEKGWFKFIDASDVVRFEEQGISGVSVGPYIILYSVGSPWYNRKVTMLNEHLVVRVGTVPGDFSTVPDALEQLARLHGCVGIVAGDALTTDPRLMRVYQRKGFRVEATNLFKEVNHG